MGQTRTYKCSKCGNTVEINEGIGFMWHTFEKSMFYPPKKDSYGLNFYDELDKDMLEEIHEFIESSDESFVADAYYQPYICKKCGKVESMLYFRIEGVKSYKAQTYRPKYKCVCGSRFRKLTTKELKHLCCSKCGTDMEEVSELHMFWD